MPGFLVILLIPIFILPVVMTLALRRARLPGKITPWGTRFNLDSVFSAEDQSRLISAFVESWITKYPADKKALIQAIGDLDIQWEKTRITIPENESKVFAVMENTGLVRIWIGPRLLDGKRHLTFTALLDQLAKLAQFVNNREVNTSTNEVKEVLAKARDKYVGFAK